MQSAYLFKNFQVIQQCFTQEGIFEYLILMSEQVAEDEVVVSQATRGEGSEIKLQSSEGDSMENQPWHLVSRLTRAKWDNYSASCCLGMMMEGK
jgi:hypothetical protein